MGDRRKTRMRRRRRRRSNDTVVPKRWSLQLLAHNCVASTGGDDGDKREQYVDSGGWMQAVMPPLIFCGRVCVCVCRRKMVEEK